MNVILFKLSHNILVSKMEEMKKKNQQTTTKIQSKTNLKTEEKERVADELTDQMKHFLIYVIFVLRNQVKPPVIMDGRLGCSVFRTMWF